MSTYCAQSCNRCGATDAVASAATASKHISGAIEEESSKPEHAGKIQAETARGKKDAKSILLASAARAVLARATQKAEKEVFSPHKAQKPEQEESFSMVLHGVDGADTATIDAALRHAVRPPLLHYSRYRS